jgi:hypothetical protein
MGINISVVGSGLAAILGAGSVILAILDKAEWVIFIIAAVMVFVVSLIIK